MKGHLSGVEESAAYGAKLSQAEIVVYQKGSKVAEHLRKIHQCAGIKCNSSSEAVNASMGSELAGRRTFSVLSDCFDVSTLSYMRLPAVAVNMSSSIKALLESGCLVFLPESNQDLVESVIQAYKICEDPRILLPGLISVDMKNYKEVIFPPNEAYVKRFVSRLKLPFGFKRRSYFGVPLGIEDYKEYRMQQHKAMENSAEAVEKSSSLWKKKFKKSLGSAEKYKTDDADIVLVMSGFHSTTAKSAVDKLRQDGKKFGLLRLRIVRPWPSEELKVLAGKKVGLLENEKGIFYKDVKPHADFCSDFINLGRHLNENDFSDIFSRIQKSQKEETVWL